MPLLKPDPTFYPSPTMAPQSTPEKLAYLGRTRQVKCRGQRAHGLDMGPSSFPALQRAHSMDRPSRAPPA